jgi:hypothetical protein
VAGFAHREVGGRPEGRDVSNEQYFRERLREVEAERESLRLERDAVEHNRLKDNEHLLARVERLEAALQERQAAIDSAMLAMRGSEYVGGPTEREAWRAALTALGPYETQHQGQDPERVRGVLRKGDTDAG